MANKYREYLSDVKEIKLPAELETNRHVYHLFVIQVLDDCTLKRDDLAKYLNGHGIAFGLHYPIPLHLQTCFSDLGYKKGDFPVSEKLSECGLSLPIFPELSDEQIRYVAEKVRNFFEG